MQGMYFLGQDLCTPLYVSNFTDGLQMVSNLTMYFHFEIDPRLPKDLCTLKLINRQLRCKKYVVKEMYDTLPRSGSEWPFDQA